MKNKMLYGILIFCVSVLMLMPNALAAGGPPYVWANQATLSTVDVLPSQDPENSGFGTTQVTVWEEWNGADWDIYMKYSLLDGALLSWIFSPVHPAITVVDEINPAVSVTRNHRVFGQEIHVVYQSWNPVGFWEIMHTYTANFGVLWTLPVPISTPGVDSTNPAIVYTEDQALVPPPPAGTPFVVQAVWEEALPGGGTQIMYRAHVYDPTWVPVRGYLPGILAVPFLIRGPPLAPGSSELPEIASTDERLNPPAYDFNFNIVWQEFDPIVGNWNIWYVDGTTTTSAVPPPPPPGIAIAVPGMLNALAPATVDHTDPDIAAS